jgi:arginine decarboxylase
MRDLDLREGRWTCERAEEVYGVDRWGAGYFRIAESGEMCVCPDAANPAACASLSDIVGGLRERGQGLPVLLRFEDILASRVRLINERFAQAMAEYGYRGSFRGVFPIKVTSSSRSSKRSPPSANATTTASRPAARPS